MLKTYVTQKTIAKELSQTSNPNWDILKRYINTEKMRVYILPGLFCEFYAAEHIILDHFTYHNLSSFHAESFYSNVYPYNLYSII